MTEVSDGSPAPAPVSKPSTRTVRLLGWMFVVLAVLMLPWTAYLAAQLPSSQRAAHYDLAWGGFDAAIVLSLAATAWAATRTSPWLVSSAAVTGTLLATDAWFDVVTAATSKDLWLAVAMAVLVEVPLAGVCLWLTVNGHQLELWRAWRRARPGRSRRGLRH